MADIERSGTINKNTKKSSEKAPDYFGFFVLNGEKYRIAGWKNYNSDTGEKFIGIKINDFDENYSKKSFNKSKPNRGYSQQKKTYPTRPTKKMQEEDDFLNEPDHDDDDDDLPF